jgi:hypothetical protein
MGNSRLWGAKTDSFEVALNKGRVELQQMVEHFNIRWAAAALHCTARHEGLGRSRPRAGRGPGGSRMVPPLILHRRRPPSQRAAPGAPKLAWL